MAEKKKQGFWFIFIRVYFVILFIGITSVVFYSIGNHVGLRIFDEIQTIIVGGLITTPLIAVPIYILTLFKKKKNSDKGEASAAIKTHDQQMIAESKQRREEAKKKRNNNG